MKSSGHLALGLLLLAGVGVLAYELLAKTSASPVAFNPFAALAGSVASLGAGFGKLAATGSVPDSPSISAFEASDENINNGDAAV